MELSVTAPNRIDLAGGTTDLYPLYLLMGGGSTVNIAIDVNSRVTFRPRSTSGVSVASVDLGASVEAIAPEELPREGPLSLVCRAVQLLPPPNPVHIETGNNAPAGSGLGASSALLVALLTGLFRLRGEVTAPAELIDTACAIETSCIGVPAGKQDYIAAYFGGVSLLRFGFRGFSREPAAHGAAFTEKLERTLILSYTGDTRFSGANNWEMTKAFIDDLGGVREKLTRIRDIARSLGEALREENPQEIASLVDEEWRLRRTLAPGISTPRIDSIMAAAKKAGAAASKICGAGGGGCMVTVVDEDSRSEVEKALTGAGGVIMPFSVNAGGTEVQES